MATAKHIPFFFLSGISLLSSTALAADISAPVSDWTGWHVGVGAGYGMVDHNLSGSFDDGGDVISGKLTGIAGEGGLLTAEFGYDKVVSSDMLLGATVDYTRSGISSDLFLSPVAGQMEATDAVSILVRGGRIINNNTVLYGLAGWTHTWMNGDLSDGGGPIGSYDYQLNGLSFGGGIETAIANNMTLKFEHRMTLNGGKTFLDDDIGFGTIKVGEHLHEQTARVVLSYRPGIAAPSFDGEDHWSGFRVGGAAGYGMVNHVIAEPGGPSYFSGLGGEGLLASAEIGFDKQLGERFVLGAQADYTFSDISSELFVTDGTDTISGKITPTHNFSLLARGGVLTSPDVLVYGLAGWTRSRFDLSFAVSGGGPSDSLQHSLDGITLGGGAEVMLNDRWSWKGEYRYTNYDSWDALGAGVVDIKNNIQSVRSELSYHF